MELNDQLKELVSEISPTDSQQSALRDAHIRLRERLKADDNLKTVDSRNLPSGQLPAPHQHTPSI